MAGNYVDSWHMTWLVCSEWDDDTWHYHGEWFGATWPRHGLPRGTLLLVGCIKFIWSPPDSTPRPPPACKVFAKSTNQCAITCCLLYIWFKKYLSLNCVHFGRGSGWGLAPAHGYIGNTYDRWIKCTRIHISNG
jgi:hypothetical protein